MEGFSICNTDGTEGLTFDEINACRVNNNFTQYVDTTYLIVKFLEFQIRLGKFVVYSWPSASDFDAADDNGDGNLTIDEFVQYLGQKGACYVVCMMHDSTYYIYCRYS